MQQNEVHQLLEAELRALAAQLDQLVNQELARFNELLRQRNIGNVVAVN